jgi:hypothetical protein
MQLREGSFHGPRPTCPGHPKQPVYRLGFYERYEDCDSHRKMIMTIFAGIAEFERDLIRERTGAGREAAKKRGVQFGPASEAHPGSKTFSATLSFGRKVSPRNCIGV